jgi:hypothetical protein
MKNNLLFIVFAAIFILFCFQETVSASKLKILVNYKKGAERIDSKPPDIKDGYWRMFVTEVPPSLEKEKYTAVIEGYDAISNYSDTLNLFGISVDRKSLLFPINGVFDIQNKENFVRSFDLFREGEESPVAKFEIPAGGSVSYSFISSGEYTLVDTIYSWNIVRINVLNVNKLIPFNEGSNSFEITDISSGTYTLRIYYGSRWIYQEDFIVVGSSTQTLGYKIENGNVESVPTGTYTTTVGGMIVR